jgi:chromosome segregation ATPase
MKEQIEAALAAKDAEIERLNHKIGLLEDLCKYFRDAVGECHVMISRNTPEYQIRHEWEPTDLPPRMQKVMQRAEAAEAALTARDAEIATLREHLAAAVRDHCDLADWKEPMSDTDKLCAQIESERAAKESLRERIADAEHWMSQEFNAAWQAEMTTLREQRIAALERAEIAERALDAAREDTARLDWLETQHDVQAWRNGNGRVSFVCDDAPSDLKEGNTFRAALDAARSGEGQ